MNLWTYIKDRSPWIVMYLVSNCFTVIIMQLDHLRSGWAVSAGSAAYAFILALFFLVIIIAADYMRKRGVYRLLNSIEKDGCLENAFKAGTADSGEHGFFMNILMKSFHSYEDKLAAYKNRQKEQLHFINQWVHMMKTPVSVINLILEDGEEKIDKSKVESLREEVEKLSHGLEMALYNARINDFEQDFVIEKADIISIVRNVINEHKKEFIRYSIYPRIEQKEASPVETDAKWMRFVINQIISNSIKYSRFKEDGKKEILIDMAQSTEGLVISIKDEGVGIPPGDIKRVFQPFFTGFNGRKFPESTGMGMYLSKLICQKLGHNISIESEEGKWTKVTIVFPKGRSLYNMPV